MGEKLSTDFYQHPDVVHISKVLLGKVVVTELEGKRTSGIIVETEAYCGRNDKACHAHMGRFTERTKIMYEAGGVAYVYLCYGIHHLFNIITNKAGVADAVLIRAIEPVEGIETMLMRRNMTEVKTNITAGPGMASQALGIHKSMSGISLTDSAIWIEEQGNTVDEKQIKVGTRVGVAYAMEDALLPWRFSIMDNKFVSKAK